MIMAYNDVALLANDQGFISRTAAAYATETLSDADHDYPVDWANQHSWDLAAQPGFGDAYASALASGTPDPGTDPAVISDAMILSGIQAILGIS
jgi:hypothetical protein